MRHQIKKLKQKILSLLIISVLIIISFFYSKNLYCQSISLISEIYDYEIGDIFHVHEWGQSNDHAFSKYHNIEIINKYYSAGNDTLFYISDINIAEISSNYPYWTHENYIDTLFYCNLDSLINNGIIDTVYTNSSFYNNRTINFVRWQASIYLWEDKKFIEGCGGPYRWWNDIMNGTEYHYNLKYFKKGNEEWGIPLYVSINNIQKSKKNISIYPNPTKNKIHIDLRNSDNKYYEGYVFSINGRLIKRIDLKPKQINVIDISDVIKGVYLIKIKLDDQIFNKVIIKY